MSLNVELFSKIKDAIRANPEQFCMAVWDCGTYACIAGCWAVRLAGGEAELNPTGWKTTQGLAAELLGIDYWNGNGFFTMMDWPQPLITRYFSAASYDDHLAMAEVACEAIDWLIEQHDVAFAARGLMYKLAAATVPLEPEITRAVDGEFWGLLSKTPEKAEEVEVCLSM